MRRPPLASGTLSLLLPLALVAAQEPKVRPAAGPPKSGEVNTPPARGERVADTLKVGDPAPEFRLPRVKGTGEIALADYRGKKPVVLIFGSYT